MGGIIKSVKGLIKGPPKAPRAPIAPPAVDTAGVRAAGDAERRRQRSAGGRAATALTGGQGVTTDANIGTKKLLG